MKRERSMFAWINRRWLRARAREALKVVEARHRRDSKILRKLRREVRGQA